MNKVPYTNETDRFVHIGGVMIPPHDTRDVDPRLVPGYQAEGKSADVPLDPLTGFLAGKADAVKIGIPALSDEDLARAELLEAEGKKRKGVLEAIAAEKLVRAEKAAGGEGGEGGGE